MPATLDDSMPKQRPRRAHPALMLFMSALVAITAVRIEILNTAAGGLLPRQERSGDGDMSPWRQSLCTTETRWRELCGPRNEGGQPVGRTLTANEQVTMIREIRLNNASNKLRNVVSSWGLLQYVLVPVLLIWSARMIVIRPDPGRRRFIGALGACVATLAGALVLYRQYLQNLGWWLCTNRAN